MKVLAACFVVTVAVLTFLAASAMRDVTIRLSRTAVPENGEFWMTCVARKDTRNRMWNYGVVGLRPDSEQPIAGERGPNMIQIDVTHIPCDVGPAYCAVIRNDGSGDQAVQPFEIGGCNH